MVTAPAREARARRPTRPRAARKDASKAGSVSLVDRFICRREGHQPSVRITRQSGVNVISSYCTCLRCGKWLEVKGDTITQLPGKPPPR